MWTINQTDFPLLLGGAGQPFTGFVDALIRAHGFVYGLREADIRTSLRTSIADGGVDTEVRSAMSADPTGFLLTPTCWQYKALAYASITDDHLRKEIQKPYAKQLIEKGYAYRLAICDDMPPQKQTAWEKLLTDQAQEINPQAPPVLVATASLLAAWANRYPSLIPAHFGCDAGPVLHFEAWSRNITKATPTFVPMAAWTGTQCRIENHMDLNKSVAGATLSVQGMAGVGKTRLVHEVVAKLQGSGHLVLYTNDGDDAKDVACALANDGKTRCILIADECTNEARVKIGTTLKGHTDRIRVVCIDNSGDRPLNGEEELNLKELSPSGVDQVLEQNFPLVPGDRRRAYAGLSGGYIRFAADLCEHDWEVDAQGHFGPAPATVQDYYRDRIPDEQKRAVEAMALVQKVGFGIGVSEELDELCKLTGQIRQQVLEAATFLKDAPGFVARTTRYLYITPEIIAGIAFANAHQRWIEADPDEFLGRIPPILLESFQARVARSASQEVRTRIGRFFQRSIASLRPIDLADEKVVGRLTKLVNTDPVAYFSQFGDLVRRASLKELKENVGQVRRTLVWTAQQFAGFPNFFTQSEEILRRLALAETEDGVGNNATGVWKELFRIQLSGSATPFPQRIDLLERLVFSPVSDESALALDALTESLTFTDMRMLGPSIVAGQLVPPNWHPNSFNEFQNCLDLILTLLDRVFASGSSEMLEKAWPTLGHHVASLLDRGMLPGLQEITQRRPIPPAYLPVFIESIELFLRTRDQIESVLLGVGAWLAAITPNDFHGRLKAIAGKNPWHPFREKDLAGVPSEIHALADQLNQDPAKLQGALPFLNSREAASASILGEALGLLDADAKHLDDILTAAMVSGSDAFACGYIDRLMKSYPAFAPRLNAWLDRLETEAPIVAYYLSLSATEFSHPLDRTLRLINAGKLPANSLRNFVARVRLDPDQLAVVLGLLLETSDVQCLHIAIDFVGYLVQTRQTFDPVVRAASWRVLEASASIEDRADYWWDQGVQALMREDPERACQVAIRALTGEDYHKRLHAWQILSMLAKSIPDLVISRIGQVLLDKENGWQLRVGARTGFLQSLPFESVKGWLLENGLEGARVIAHHLQPPSVDDTGTLRLHPLTEYVLTAWDDDEVVSRLFVASTHHLQMYGGDGGDVASTHRREAETARPFFSHPLAGIRLWAQHEVDFGEAQALRWTILNEEDDL